jgi:ComF family protein
MVQKLIHSLKYRGKQEIGTLLGTIYGGELKKKKIEFDYIIPVPLHKKKLKERGYNQITTFCEAIANELAIEINRETLVRKKYNVSQTKKNKDQRDAVKEDIFGINYNLDLENKHLLLIDDVLTTGATLETCAKLLLQHKGSSISIITIAYTYS